MFRLTTEEHGDLRSQFAISNRSQIVTPYALCAMQDVKTFTDRQRDKFLTEAFEYIANFFEGSLSELKKRNPEADTEFRRVDANSFVATIYIRGSLANRCRIWLSGRGSYPGGIAYSVGGSLESGGFNESLSVTDDGYALFLKALGLSLHMRDREEKMTFEGSAEYLWGIFIEVLQH